jgi:hypothetical protein
MTPLSARAGDYTFTTIVDSTSGLDPDFAAVGQRKINDSGEVPFVTQPSFANYHLYKGSGGPLTHIAGAPSMFSLNRVGNGAVMNSGEVVFTGSTQSFNNGIYRGSGGGITPIITAQTAPTTAGPKTSFFATSVNNLGDIAYQANHSICSGDPVTCSAAVDGYYAIIDGNGITLAETGGTWGGADSGAPVINDAGQVLFEMSAAEDNQYHLLRYNGPSLTTIDDDLAGGAGYWMNNAGDVAISEPASIRVVTSSGTITIADTDDGFAGLMASGNGQVFINDTGQVAFWAYVDEFQGNPVDWDGVYAGPDIVNDRVLVFGESVLGHTVNHVELLGMNNVGQMLLSVDAQSPDTWRALLVATPTATTGDYNHDEINDAADYVVWRKGIPPTNTPSHYDIWRTHFGEPVGGGGSTSATIPEPATLVLALAATLALFYCTRCHTSNAKTR